MKDYKQINKETYTAITYNWDEKRTVFWKPIIEFLKKIENKKDKKFLDLGCGAGRNLQLAKNLGFNKIIGIDFAKGQIKNCEEKGFNVILGDLEFIPLEDNSQDIIICIATLHHLLEKKSQIKALKEMKRVLKTSGKILLSNWHPTKEYIKTELKKKKFEFLNKENNKVKVKFSYNNSPTKHDRYYYFFKEEEILNLCEKVGFKIITTLFHKENNNFKGNFYLEIE